MAFLETLKLGFDNNLIMGNAPDKILLEHVAKKISEQNLSDGLESFGLFDSNTANYNTYYPDVTVEDLQPKEEEFIQPVFRALSEVIVHKEYNPVDFGMNNVLKKSTSLLRGATVNADHETSIGNALGAVKEVAWQDSYKTDKGILVPAGINSKLKIDGKSHPRAARAILMDPPAIHSTSVTVQFLWEKSHAELSQEEFFNKLGSLDKDGKLVRRIASEIKRYHEISLVSHGADPYAQLIKDAQIVNPRWGDISYNSLTGAQKKKQTFFFFDYKTDVINNSIPKETNNNIPNKQTKIMDKEFLISLAAVLGITLANSEEPGEAETQQVQDAVSTLINTQKANGILISADKQEITRLKEIETKYIAEKATFAEAVQLKEFRDTELLKLRNTVKNNYKVILGKSPEENDPIAKLLDGASYETLSALNIQYTAQLEDKFPLTCKKCGATEVNRASAIQSEGDDGKKNNPSNFRETLKNKIKSRGKGIGM
jgi:hypothetical protein